MPSPPHSDVTARVVGLIAEWAQVDPSGIRPSSRVSQDFGLDGDDAAELFEQFGRELNVDLTSLSEHWDEHFAPEGGPGLGCFALAAAAALAGELLRRVLGLIPWWGWTLVLLSLFVWIYNRFVAKEAVSVTVQDLIDAAQAGRWVKSYGEGVNEKASADVN